MPKQKQVQGGKCYKHIKGEWYIKTLTLEPVFEDNISVASIHFDSKGNVEYYTFDCISKNTIKMSFEEITQEKFDHILNFVIMRFQELKEEPPF